jgi:SnoaL-like domain
MNKVVTALAMCVLTAGSAQASDKDDIMAVLKQWSSGAAGTVAVCADDAAVIDDIPPFEWHGPGACSRWQKDNDAYLRQGISDETFTIENPQQLIISGDRAYTVLPITYTFTQKGKRVREHATGTLVLHKTAAGWRIAAWTWATQTVQ